MKEETENQINDRVREIYEPRYGRRLSDEEVHEIRTNLTAFAEGIMEIAERLYSRTDNPPESEDRTQTVGHEG